MPAGYHDPGWTKPKPKPVPPGPPKQPSVTYTSTSHAGQYDLKGYSAGAAAQAEQIANDFGGFLGWPGWYNFNAMVLRILGAGLQADTTSAYKFLWSLTPHSIRDANVNAFFGLTKQQYLEKLNNLSDMFTMYTGSSELPSTLRNQALSENWTQSELLSHLQNDPNAAANAPWLAAGLTFRDVASQFGSTYGHTPDTPENLGSWWKFRTGAQSVGQGAPAAQVAAPPPPLTARTLSSDVETR